MKIFFSHGKESGPKGKKIIRLETIAHSKGFKTESIDYTHIDNPDKRTELLIEKLRGESEEIILVGSSMGGYVSISASEQVKIKGLFLLAPALYLQGYSKQNFNPPNAHIEIVHGWNDDVVPAENSIKFAQKHHCNLHLINGDHRLTDNLDFIADTFSNFISLLLRYSGSN